MAGRLEGKVALVVGGGSGMGRAGAAAMAAEGASVVVADIALERAERVTASIQEAGGAAAAMHVDVASAELVQRVVEDTVARLGRLDVLYHCAADVHFVNTKDARVTELDDDVWQRMIDVHLTGTFYVLKHAGRQMLAQRSGSMIVSSTVDALVGCAGLDSYTAAKGGVTSMVRSFAAGVGRDGVRVNAIAPSFVSTEPQLVWLEPPHPADPDSRADCPVRRLPRERRVGRRYGHGLPRRRRLHGVQGAGGRHGHNAGWLLTRPAERRRGWLRSSSSTSRSVSPTAPSPSTIFR
jgi:NAD(P)-dependent dehydrogenase (short-subunit alcohol dehydrogenase family)